LEASLGKLFARPYLEKTHYKNKGLLKWQKEGRKKGRKERKNPSQKRAGEWLKV
jgi:hypothetical protein